MRENIMDLINEDLSNDVKREIFLNSISDIRKVENDVSYGNIISEISGIIEKNISSYENNGSFKKEEIVLYIEKYEKYMEEYNKYQVWVVADKEKASQIVELIDTKKLIFAG